MSQKEAKIEKIRQWIAASGAEETEDPANMSDKELEQTLTDLGLNKSADLGGGRRRSRLRRRRSRSRRRGGSSAAKYMNNSPLLKAVSNSESGSRNARKGGARRSRKACRSRNARRSRKAHRSRKARRSRRR